MVCHGTGEVIPVILGRVCWWGRLTSPLTSIVFMIASPSEQRFTNNPIHSEKYVYPFQNIDASAADDLRKHCALFNNNTYICSNIPHLQSRLLCVTYSTCGERIKSKLKSSRAFKVKGHHELCDKRLSNPD